MNNIACIIVTYNPESSAIDSIKKIMEENAYIIIVDNGSKDTDTLRKVQKIINENHMDFFQYNENKGLACAQNKGIEIAISKNLDYVTFFDQDTIIPNNFFTDMYEGYLLYEETYNEKLGILAPNYLDRNTEEFARFAKLTKWKYEHRSCTEDTFTDVSFVISSGSFMRIDTIKDIGLFIDDFFIDQVDTEYSLRMLSRGYKIAVYKKVLLNHTIGNRSKENFFGLTIKPNHHNEERKFYILRNGVKCMVWYGWNYKGFIVLMTARFIHDIIGTIFYENKKMLKIKSMMLGTFMGFKKINNWN